MRAREKLEGRNCSDIFDGRKWWCKAKSEVNFPFHCNIDHKKRLKFFIFCGSLCRVVNENLKNRFMCEKVRIF